ncbi:hypothetical protein, partial [Butyrivibrio sp. YAB3001]|uniref:hypothetical protein n=1 Tax=Butyrivibrio sp. YAB3001 TaxID=1520812 RepID=UPI0008F655FC
MKKNNVTNKRLLTALSIGISAMMALQTPITAYANTDTDSNSNNDNEPEVTDQTNAESDEYVPVTAEAQSLADSAQEACVDEESLNNSENSNSESDCTENSEENQGEENQGEENQG